MSNAVKNRPSVTSKSNSGSNWLPKAIGALVALIAIIMFVFLFGSVSGEEFNPWTFRRQSYKYVQIPLLRVQIMPTRYKSRTGPAANSIAPILGLAPDPEFDEEDFGQDEDDTNSSKPKIAVVKTQTANPAGRWDLVTSRRVAAVPWHGEAKILCDLLDMRDHKRNVTWKKWNTDHPKAANVLWPLIARTAQANLYVLIPELLEIATEETNAKKLQAKLEPFVVSEAEKMGAAFSKNSNHGRALESFQLALDYDANSTVAAAGIAKAKQAIADLEAAAAEPPAGKSTTTTKEPPPAEVDGEFNDDTL